MNSTIASGGAALTTLLLRMRVPTSAAPLASVRRLRRLPLTSALSAFASVQEGETSVEQDFERFIQLHERDIFGYLWRMTGNEQAAYDLSQETFLRAWRYFAKVRAYDQPRAWLLHVATRVALNYRRDRRADPQRLDLAEVGEGRMVAQDHTARLAEREIIEAALLSLPRRQRAALILRDVYGYRSAEIACFLGISSAAAKMTISRAREQFRAQYDQEEAGE
ncbi:MAG TPA: RNA polymerase sigma factor [Ktedonobacterales bacterium]|nr:RNA polymerase sigma factor [Ktedonobacterales bacterium]